jgi:hypothetical protein
VFADLGRSRAIALIAFFLVALGLPVLAGSPARAAGPGSVRFDGASSLITVADNAGLRLANNFTLEARAKPVAAPKPTTIFGKSFYELSMFPASGGVQFAFVVRQGAWREARSPVLPLNRWYSIAASYDGTYMRLFIDGALVTSSALTGNVETSSRPLYIGSVEGADDIFNGFVDEVRVSDVVRYRTPYTSSLQPFATDQNTVGLWHFDEGAGSTAADSSGRGNNGSLLNGVGWSTDQPFAADTIAPAVTGIGTTAVTGRTATVRWSTSEAATSKVEYGPTAAYGASTRFDTSWVTSHAVGLAGLAPGTTYHYRVTSKRRRRQRDRLA